MPRLPPVPARTARLWASAFWTTVFRRGRDDVPVTTGILAAAFVVQSPSFEISSKRTMATNGGNVSHHLSWAWAQQRVWSPVADNLKRGLDRACASALVLAVLAAALAVVSAQLVEPAPEAAPFLSASAAVGAGVATVLQRRVGAEQLRTWTEARSAAEGLKSEVFTYLAGGAAYADKTDRDRVLGVNARRIVKGVEDLGRHTIGVTPDNKPLPPVTGLADYLTERVARQVEDCYRPKAAFYDRRVRRLRGLSPTPGMVTVVLSAVATSFGKAAVAAWVPVVTTASTSVAAHIAASRYDSLVLDYLRTAQHLEHLRDTHLYAPERAGNSSTPVKMPSASRTRGG